MFCFDNNYSIPGSVAIYSMLYNANKDYDYKIYILENDIKEENKKLLFKTTEPFLNVSLEFINMSNKFDDLHKITYANRIFTKEMFYKFLVSSIFPSLDKIMVSDVDVVFLGDSSTVYNDFEKEENYYFSASKGINFKNPTNPPKYKRKREEYTEEEKKKLCFGAGFMVFNLKKMREDNIEEKFVEYAYQNAHKLLCPEQDVMNIVCYPKIKPMPINALIGVSDYTSFEKYADNLDEKERNEIEEALNSPIQLHYAQEQNKPWNNYCPKIDIWYEYLIKTPFFKPYIEEIYFKLYKRKTLLTFTSPLIVRKFTLIKERIKK